MSNTALYKTIRAMVEGAIFVAIAEMLGFLKIGHLPNGGSISLMMLPIVIYALRWGLRDGLLAGLVLGIIDFLINGGAPSWQSILGDYIFACALIGLAGVGHKKGLPGVIAGAILGCLGRFACVLATGATLWGEFMPETFLGLTMTNTWFYSFLYNGITVGLSGVITVIVCVMIYQVRGTQPYLLGHDIQ